MSSLPRIPRYDLLDEVGSGGMSVVYRARDTHLDRIVAVKVLHRHLAMRDAERQRFRREAQAVARLRHPNILEIHDFSGVDAEEAFIVSEFIRGPTLREFADAVGFGLPEIGAMVAERLAGALAHAHGLGIIHRDIKPENVMIQDDGALKLTDFGVARMVDRDERMTMTGALLGSPAHMAPEIVEGVGGDARSDLFSLGTVLYWLACGALPYAGGSPAEVLRRILDGAHTDPREVDPRISDELADIIQDCLARDPERRPPSAEHLRARLAEHLESLGLTRLDAELARFFAEPAAYKAELKERLVEGWLARARRAAHARDVAGAIRACERTLVLAPGHEGATELLRTLHRRRSRRRAVAAGTATAATLGLAYALATATPLLQAAPASRAQADGPAPNATRRPEASPVAAVPERSAAPEPGTEAPVPSPSAEAPAPAPAPTSSQVAARRAVRVLVTPFAHIYLDGTHLAYDIEGRTELPVGTHRLRIEREGFVPIEETIQVRAGSEPQVLRRRLVPKPATLHVMNPQGAFVSVDGVLRGTAHETGLQLPVTFPELPGGHHRIPLTVRVRLEKPGFVPVEREVTLHPGEPHRLVENLEPES